MLGKVTECKPHYVIAGFHAPILPQTQTPRFEAEALCMEEG